MRTYCCNLLPPKPSAYLISIVDIILGCVALLLSILALSDLEKVFGPLLDSPAEDEVTFDFYNNRVSLLQARLDKFGHLHGQMILLMIISGVFLFLAIGLLCGIQKDWAWPIKCWLIYGCTLTLLGIISVCVVTVITGELLWLLLFIATVIRIYEIWIILDYLRNSRFSPLIISGSRGSSCERLHNV